MLTTTPPRHAHTHTQSKQAMAAGQEEATPTSRGSSFTSAFPALFFKSSTPQEGAADGHAAAAVTTDSSGAAPGSGAGAADAQTSTSSAASNGAAAAASVAVGVSHALEWNVAAYTVPWKKGTKNILLNIGACGY